MFHWFFAVALVFGSTLSYADCLGDSMGSASEGKSGLLASALNDLNSFSYIRHQLDLWVADGDSLCATGIPLAQNIYQYYRWYIQIDVRSPSGQRVASVPVLFQTSSIQAHDTTGPKPWSVMPYQNVAAIFSKIQFTAQETLATFPLPTSADFGAAIKAQEWGQNLNESNLSVMPFDELNTFLVSWLELVPGTGGGFYTQLFSPKMILIRYLADGQVEVDHSRSAFNELLAPLDSLLSSIDYPDDTDARQALVRQFSEINGAGVHF